MSLGHREPAKAAPIVLDPAWTLEHALKVAVRACLAHADANAGCAARSRDSEYLHQVRVALRRLRSVLRLEAFADAALAGVRADLRWLSAALGPARDWDVLIGETLPPIVEEYARAAPAAAGPGNDAERLFAAAKRRRGTARGVARAALASTRYASFRSSIEYWLGSPPQPDLRITTLGRHAARELDKRHRRLLRAGAFLRQQPPEQRHRVRISAKRLRYSAEFFGSLFPARAVRRYLRELAALQDALGALNDAATATRLLQDLRCGAGLAPFIRGWIAARETACVSEAQAALQRLDPALRFWKPATPSRGQP
jgi:CHAD domain-containing protein